MTEYLIPAGIGEVEQVEKRSRFIGHVFPVFTEDEAIAQRRAIREKHKDANHNVYAYIIRETGVIRYSDAGEPQGTAGQPVLHVFSSEKITNVLCVVTRYFGGTLLGTGGLVRAYSHAAKAALDAAGVSAVRPWSRISMQCAYAKYERLNKIVLEQGAIVEHTDFGADVTMEMLVPLEQETAFCAHMIDVSAGTAQINAIGQQERAVKIR